MKNKKRFKKVIAVVTVSVLLVLTLVISVFAQNVNVANHTNANIGFYIYYTNNITGNTGYREDSCVAGNTWNTSYSDLRQIRFYTNQYVVTNSSIPATLNDGSRIGSNIYLRNSGASYFYFSSYNFPASSVSFYSGTYAFCIGKLREWNMFTSNFADSMTLTNHSDAVLNVVTYSGSSSVVADGTTELVGLKTLSIGDTITAGKYLLFDQLPAESENYQIFDNYIVKADEVTSLDFVSDELISELNYYAFDTYDAALAKGAELGLIDIPTVGEQLVDAMTAGFGMAPSFGSMIQDTFKNVFLTSEVDEQGNVSITGLSDFGSVSLILVGIAIVTGLGMLIFRRFFKRS